MTKKSKLIKEKVIRAYALKNAIEHEGKARVNSVLNSLFVEGLKKEDIKSIIVKISLIVNEVNKLGIELQKQELDGLKKIVSHRKVKKEGELPNLPRAKKGKVVMRIAPSASGPLHLFHAINLSLNYNYVMKYIGRLYVRIEDTNPENVYGKAYKMIEQEAKWLTKNKAKVAIQSDRMKIYYKYIKELIKKKAGYVCTCDVEEFKRLMLKKKACECRQISIKENLKRWEKMLDKKGYKPGEAVLRFKSSLNDSNPAMRDFPLARINVNSHPRQGKKFKVWPLMNLAVAIDDMDLKMTHIIRGKDHRDNAKRQEMIFKVFKKKYPWTAFLGRYHFTDLEISTSKFRKEIEKGKYKGWADPRLPTVASLKKRKYKPEAFWKMAKHIGLSEVDKVIKQKDFFEVLDKFN